jgi:LacI family transcriptional regulator
MATASKALNGRDHVRAETRERVERAAEQLNFVPAVTTYGSKSIRTGTVGLLTSDLEGRFSIPVLMGAEDAFGAGSTSVFLCDARGDPVREQHQLRALLSRRVDGLIVVGDQTNPRPSLGQNLPVPVVYAYAPSSDPRDISVISDNVEAGRIAAQHLIDCGRSRIAYIGGDVSYNAARDRATGALETVHANGLEFVGGSPLFGAWTEEWGRGATRIQLARDPDLDAILCGSDQIARGVLDVLKEEARDVPQNISVMGHDNWEQIAGHSRPPLSTVDMNLKQIGNVAAQMLFAAIDGKPQPGNHTVSCRVVVRGSTAAGD